MFMRRITLLVLVTASLSAALDAHATPAPAVTEIPTAAAVATEEAKPVGVPYPTSRVIEGVPLGAEIQASLDNLILLPKRDKERKKIKDAICGKRIAEPEPNTVKTPLAITETDMAIDIAFTGTSDGTPSGKKEVSVFIEFNPEAVLIKPRNPRFASDADGVWVPYPFETTRGVWIQGKDNSDLLFLVPDVDECGIQAIAICPRTLGKEKPKELVATDYTPTASRYLVSGKADGLFALGQNQAGRVQASLLTTEGIAMPETWQKSVTSSTPSATLKYATPRKADDVPPPFISGTVPIISAVEARLDFGTPTESLRTVKSRTTIEVREIEIPEMPESVVRDARKLVEGGKCFVVSQWGEAQL